MMTTNEKMTQAFSETQIHAEKTLAAGNDLINRSYLSALEHYPIARYASDIAFNSATDVRIYRIERIVQDNKQSVLESTTAAYTALGAAGYSVFLFLSSDGLETNLYIGTRGEPGKALGANSGELLQATFRGHFAGSALQPLKAQDVNALLSQLSDKKEKPSASITSVTGVPALSSDNRDHFMQGLERFIDAAEGEKYQALILAEPVSTQNLDLIRTGYEQVATQLSPLLKQQISYGEQDSDTVGLSISQSLSTSLGHSLGLTETRGTSHALGTSTSETKASAESKAANLVGTFGGAAIGYFATGGNPMGAMLGANLGGAAAAPLNSQETSGSSETHGTSESHSVARTQSNTETKGTTDTQSINRTAGSSRQISIETTNKSVEQLLDKIDHHLQRVDEAKTYGGWSSAAYFIGEGRASSESLASIFLGLIRGSKSSHEDFALTTWNSNEKSEVLDWLSCLSHPQLKPDFSDVVPVTYVTPATLISGKEMAIQLSLPRRSTSTVSVVETQAFGRKVQRVDGHVPKGVNARMLKLGNVRHLWENLPQPIELDMDQLASHLFVTGSTGAGKSNTLYEILDQVSGNGVPFLVVEPAKGEYKHVFGHRSDVTVLGTNPEHSALLKINPFRFPRGIHVLEHIDRLVEIFNVCWPMYAAMPAVLKDAILEAYKACGWDLEHSSNHYSDDLFPTFLDLLDALQLVIDASAYSQELKGNYIGSLSTRVKSLTNGLNGQLFGANEIESDVLFDSNVIVDLSRVGSSETKALIMGVIVMRLSEHRMAHGGMNQPLRHITVLEEAHNLLKRSSDDSGVEGASLVGKSVEMLANAIAEMRTYGEGFIIADQSPNAVDIAAIRNTNTKIIMRLPDEADRHLAGKSVALRDDQLEEISRLPKGVAIVYQNDWLEPVLCQIGKFSGEEKPYLFQLDNGSDICVGSFNAHVLRFLLKERVKDPLEADIDLILCGLKRFSMPAYSRVELFKAVSEHREDKAPVLCGQEAFGRTARLLIDVLGCRQQVVNIINDAVDYADLGRSLDQLLAQKAGCIPADLALAAQQSIMKDYSLQKEKNIEIYSMWVEHNKNGVVR